MSSKSNKKGCSHVFVQGSKKGTKCGKGCRGKFCKNHKLSKAIYHSTWYQEKQQAIKEKNNHEVINKINKMSLEQLPNIVQVQAKLNKFATHKIYLCKKLIGINIFLDIDQTKEIKIMENIIFGKCKCETEITFTNDEINEARNNQEITCYLKNNKDETIIKELKSEKFCIECQGYNTNNCKHCLRPIGKVIYFDYKGKI